VIKKHKKIVSDLGSFAAEKANIEGGWKFGSYYLGHK